MASFSSLLRHWKSMKERSENWYCKYCWIIQVKQTVFTWHWGKINQSIQFWSGFIPVNGGGQIYPTLTAISPMPTLHLARFMASSFSKPTLLLSFSACIFHVLFGRPHVTSDSNAFLKTCPSSFLNICPYHLAPFTCAFWTTVSTVSFNSS